jgi:hypothetical protein
MSDSSTFLDRRVRTDRRTNEAIAQFPIITRQGICVRRDRRKIPDRRMSNITVTEAKIKPEVFDTLFNHYMTRRPDKIQK